MARECYFTGKKTKFGRSIARRGKDANLPFPEMPVVRDGRG